MNETELIWYEVEFFEKKHPEVFAPGCHQNQV